MVKVTHIVLLKFCSSKYCTSEICTSTWNVLQIIHGNQSCGEHVVSFFIQAYKRALPVYLPVYLIPALIVHRQGLLKRYCSREIYYLIVLLHEDVIVLLSGSNCLQILKSFDCFSDFNVVKLVNVVFRMLCFDCMLCWWCLIMQEGN